MPKCLLKRSRSQRGVTLVELLVATAVFSVILAMSMTLVTRWMNISRVADSQAKAVSDARNAMVGMANDIRRAEIIVTNYKVNLANSEPAFDPAPPVIDTPVVVYNRDAVDFGVPNRDTFRSPLLANSILLIYNASGVAKGYIAYYTAKYQADHITRVGLFRYQWVSATDSYDPFDMKVKKLDDASFSVPATGELTIGSPAKIGNPQIKCIVQDLHYAHAPGYIKENNKTSDPRYLFSISNTHPYANENWLSPFDVEIGMSVVYPVRSIQGLDYDKIDDSQRQFSTITIRTIAFAKNVLMTK